MFEVRSSNSSTNRDVLLRTILDVACANKAIFWDKANHRNLDCPPRSSEPKTVYRSLGSVESVKISRKSRPERYRNFKFVNVNTVVLRQIGEGKVPL